MAKAPERKSGSRLSRKTRLRRKTPLRRTAPSPRRKPLKRKFKPPGVAVPAHQDQRDAIALAQAARDGRRTLRCVVCGEPTTNPMHLVPRHCGGCDRPLCVLPVCNECHDAYDGRVNSTSGRKESLNLLESLLLKRYRNTKNLTDPPTDPDELARRLKEQYRPHFWHALKHVKYSDLRVALMEGSSHLVVVDRSHWSHPDNRGARNGRNDKFNSNRKGGPKR